MFLPFFGLFYVLKTASFQRFLDLTGGCGHLRSFAVTLRSRVTATRKFEIVGKWRFLCYEHVTKVLIRVKRVCFCVFSTPCQRYLCRVREVSHSETTIPSYWVFQPPWTRMVQLYGHHGLAIEKRIMRAFPWLGSRSNVHDLRPLRSFLSAPAFPFSPTLPGENRPALMVAGASMHAVRPTSNGRRTVRF